MFHICHFEIQKKKKRVRKRLEVTFLHHFTQIILHFEYMEQKNSSILTNSHHTGFVNREVWQGAHTVLILKGTRETGSSVLEKRIFQSQRWSVWVGSPGVGAGLNPIKQPNMFWLLKVLILYPDKLNSIEWCVLKLKSLRPHLYVCLFSTSEWSGYISSYYGAHL